MKAATKEEKERMAQLSMVPCIVCYLYLGVETPAEVHHATENGRRRGHKHTYPLCFPHHRKGDNCESHVSRHPFEAEFINRYGTEDYLIEETNKIIMNY